MIPEFTLQPIFLMFLALPLVGIIFCLIPFLFGRIFLDTILAVVKDVL